MPDALAIYGRWVNGTPLAAEHALLLPWLEWKRAQVTANGTPETHARRTPLSAIRPEATTWLWDQLLPQGELSIMAGREGAAKSQCSVWLLAQLSIGRLPGELYGEPGDSIICAREDSFEKTIVPRLIMAGADLSKVHRVEVVFRDGRVYQLGLPYDTDLLIEQIREVHARLVVFDPLLSVLSPSLDAHRAGEVRQAIEPLAGIAHDSGCSFLGLAHFNKSEGRDAASLITGSHAFRDVARSILVLARDPDGEGVMSHVKSNLGRLQPSLSYAVGTYWLEIGDRSQEVARWEPGNITARHVEDLLDQGQARARAEARDFLRSTLGGGARLAKEVEDEAKNIYFISSRTLDRAKKELGIISRKVANEWWWSLPDVGGLGILGNHGGLGGHGVVQGNQGTLPRTPSSPRGQGRQTPPPARGEEWEYLDPESGELRINWEWLWQRFRPQ